MRSACLILLTALALLTGGTADARVRVIAANFPAYDFVREITTGAPVDASLLLKPGMESHSFDPSPKDIIAISGCDLFVYTGGESDEWSRKMLRATKLKGVVVAMAECVPARWRGDEHVWTSPKNAASIVRSITDALCRADGANAAVYRRNAEAYLNRLAELDNTLRSLVNGAVRKKIAVADRFPFRCMVEEYGLEYRSAVDGCAEDAEPSAASVAALIDYIREYRLPVAFFIEMSDQKTADAVCSETGARKLLLHACHNVSKSDFEAGATYLSLMERNAANLREALY
ncbi:MAG: metal ABC transporter substrate-binding protein [Synergistaceae bacterium]|jgi:zinc transport system substrate-binding protein|nr:metal ABC transporter substrate-binding protein [Synergistaceae bacterium]